MLYRLLLGVLGFLLIIFGIAITLRYWYEFVFVFRVLVGPVIAVIGLVMMFRASMNDKASS